MTTVLADTLSEIFWDSESTKLLRNFWPMEIMWDLKRQQQQQQRQQQQQQANIFIALSQYVWGLIFYMAIDNWLKKSGVTLLYIQIQIFYKISIIKVVWDLLHSIMKFLHDRTAIATTNKTKPQTL